MYPFDHPSVTRLISMALEEDLGRGDVTTLATIPPDCAAQGKITAKADLTIAGLPLVEQVLQAVDPAAGARALVAEGNAVQKGTVVVELWGNAQPLLIAERTLLNFLQHLSGVATLTRRFVDAVVGTRCKIIDTRKTLAGFRLLDKYAVTQGGGTNHRMGLDDGILIKDNHIAVCGGVGAAVRQARNRASALLRIEVECTTLAEIQEALDARADIILLDNMATPQMREAVQLVNGRALLEASGNMSLERVREVAETGVDFISVGALTHSVSAADLSMAIVTEGQNLRPEVPSSKGEIK
ncbi:MAG TPA: carboxylating nicotinate-nucleotide diphosphorylase [Candidatus Binatia bacterium]|jgi:nicotinate-nucleotide pyrophosphorylase (carboxylating)|nr:carboxylating nicotinate-nucleotide diphosphorylase [Candidatus Binatia bacterium]